MATPQLQNCVVLRQILVTETQRVFSSPYLLVVFPLVLVNSFCLRADGALAASCAPRQPSAAQLQLCLHVCSRCQRDSSALQLAIFFWVLE